MENLTPRARLKLRQAQQVAEIGKRPVAEGLFRELIEEFPDAVEGWLGLASVVREPAELETIYRRVLALDPANADARHGLAQLSGAAPVAEELLLEEEGVDSAESAPTDSQTVDDVAAAIKAEARRRQEHARQARRVVQPGPSAAPDVAAPVVEVADSAEPIACYRHPDRETGLRCNRCHKPICPDCATPTPVGYRCPDCIRETEATYFTAGLADYLLAAAVAVPLSTIAAFLLGLIGFWFILLFIAPAAGTLIGTTVFRAVRRRRGRYLAHLVAVSVGFGALIALFLGTPPFSLLLYVVFAGSAAFYRLRA